MPIAFISMAEEMDLSPLLPHDKEENNEMPNDFSSDQGDDETEDELNEVEGSDVSEEAGAKKKKKKKKVGCLF